MTKPELCKIAANISSRFVWPLCLLVMIMSISAVPAAALELTAGQSRIDVESALSFTPDDGRAFGDVVEAFRTGSFDGDYDRSFNAAPIWAAVRLHNISADDGRPPDIWVLTLSTPLVVGIDVYLVRANGVTENLLAHSFKTEFVAANYEVSALRTGDISLAPSESATLFIHYTFGPVRTVSVDLETLPDLKAGGLLDAISNTAFYAFSLACLVFFFGFHVAMRNLVGVIYAVVFAVLLFFVAYLDGLPFRFLYPKNPDWDPFIGNSLLFLITSLGFLVASRSLTAPEGETRGSRIIALMALLPLLGILALTSAPPVLLALYCYGLLIIMFAANLYATTVWRRQEGNVHLAAVFVAALCLLGVAVIIYQLLTGNEFAPLPFTRAVKFVYVTAGAITLTALTIHVVNLRRQHARALHGELEALGKEARAAHELLEAERNYTRARDLASLRQTQLATASHDLRQPLASLRMSVDALAEGTEETGVKERLADAFNYIEALSTNYLDETRPGDPSEENNVEPDGHSDPEVPIEETSALEMIFDTVRQMFAQEAISKGIELRVVHSSLEVRSPPLILMRILSNLVSNAVKYTETGSVLLGARRTQHHVHLQVHDTGIGLSATQIDEFMQPYKKGEQSQGEGLGLAICFDVAKKNGLELSIASEQGCGTRFDLKVPLSRQHEHA
ncbi:MAG: ATP-binding protein [Stappiaceae bacterium]